MISTKRRLFIVWSSHNVAYRIMWGLPSGTLLTFHLRELPVKRNFLYETSHSGLPILWFFHSVGLPSMRGFLY